jgi:hypothetical protein
MRARARFAVPLLPALLALGACGSVTDIEADLTPEILTGDWEATTFQVTSVLNPAKTLDILAQGYELEFRFTLDGRAIQFFTDPDGQTVVDSATYEIDEPYLLFTTPDSAVQAFAYELQSTQVGNSLTLATADFEWDFDGQGSPEPALVAAIMIR